MTKPEQSSIYSISFLLETEFIVNVLKVRPSLNIRTARIYFLATLFKIGS